MPKLRYVDASQHTHPLNKKSNPSGRLDTKKCLFKHVKVAPILDAGLITPLSHYMYFNAVDDNILSYCMTTLVYINIQAVVHIAETNSRRYDNYQLPWCLVGTRASVATLHTTVQYILWPISHNSMTRHINAPN